RVCNAVPHRDVAHLIHCDRSHPAIAGIRGICGRLEEARCSCKRRANFIPPNCSHLCACAIRINRLIYQQTINTKTVAISQPIHQTISQTVELGGSAGLSYAAAATSARTRSRAKWDIDECSQRAPEPIASGDSVGNEIGLNLDDGYSWRSRL